MKQYKLIISQSYNIEAIINVNDNVFLEIEKTTVNWEHPFSGKIFKIQLNCIIYNIEYIISIIEEKFFFAPYKNITINTIRLCNHKTNLNDPQEDIEYIINYIIKFIDNEIFE